MKFLEMLENLNVDHDVFTHNDWSTLSLHNCIEAEAEAWKPLILK